MNVTFNPKIDCATFKKFPAREIIIRIQISSNNPTLRENLLILLILDLSRQKRHVNQNLLQNQENRV